jgi:hypothetical protein
MEHIVEQWRAKALEYFPDLRALIEEQTGPMDFWIELSYRLGRVYDQQPLDDAFIARVYAYAAWCFKQTSTGDVKSDPSSAVAVAFIEDIPLNKQVADDMHRWVSSETFDDCEALFRYCLSDKAYEKFATDFRRKKKEFSGTSLL